MDSDITQDKRDLRELVNRSLGEMTEDDRADASAAICSELEVVLQTCGTVLVFLPVPTEPDIDPFIGTLLASGRPTAAPRCNWEAGTFAPVHMRSLEEIEVRKHGLREPAESAPVSLDGIGAVLVPGLAFDGNGGRLGRGGGFYDRFISTLPASARRIGVCYAAQMVDRVPREAHDAGVDEIITENGRVFSDRSSD